MMKNVTLAIILMIVLFSCEYKTELHQSGIVKKADTLIIENKVDPICNMLVEGNLSDTALIDNKVWGFCSSACKEKYLNSK